MQEIAYLEQNNNDKKEFLRVLWTWRIFLIQVIFLKKCPLLLLW